MDFALQIIGYAAAFSLHILILHSMLRGSWRRYPFLFLYVVIDLATNLLEIRPRLMLASLTAQERRDFGFLYWWDERIIQATLFLLVISLIYRASTDIRARRILLVALVVGSILFALISFLVHYSPEKTPGKWMTPWTRNMNFGAAILDLMLWATLIRTRQKDSRLLMISGGLGIHFTAGAIGQSLRDMSRETVDIASVIIVTGNIACLYIWWHALRATAASTPTAAPAGLPLHK